MNILGYWEETLNHNSQSISFGLEFKELDSANIGATVIIREYNRKIPFGTIDFESNTVTLSTGDKLYFSEAPQAINGVAPKAWDSRIKFNYRPVIKDDKQYSYLPKSNQEKDLIQISPG